MVSNAVDTEASRERAAVEEERQTRRSQAAAATDLLAAQRPELADSRDVFLEQIQADIEHTFTSPVTEDNGLGYMSPATWETTVGILEEQDVLDAPVDPEEAYDNQFAEQANVQGSR